MDDAAKKLIKDTFDAVAEGYDGRALRFFPDSAAHMAARLPLRGDEEVLDVACGTGLASVAIARRLPRGRVTAVDFSPAMLAQARMKAGAAGLTNLDFVECDMQALGWPDRFDAAVCAFGIFFVEDMDAQLRRIAATVKPGGRVMTSNFRKDYMEPLRSLMVARLNRFGVQTPPQIWLRIAHPEACRALFEGAGLRDVQVENRDLGYFLASADEWWDVIWNAGFRRMIGRLPPAQQASFKQEHLAEIEALRTKDGIRMDVPVLFTSGIAPG
jgi:ubiquinone/menaquinone biosynthesis C-methylase UbiE